MNRLEQLIEEFEISDPYPEEDGNLGMVLFLTDKLIRTEKELSYLQSRFNDLLTLIDVRLKIVKQSVSFTEARVKSSFERYKK